ncbi:hypothetical protein GBA52_020753 [Prunus armeniaca]|nr:hypothetical protein GBA52_020753 [Prunus armeniaca]
MHNQIKENDVQGSALGAVFWLLFGAIIEVEDKTSMFTCIRGHHKYNLESLEPSVLGIELKSPCHITTTSNQEEPIEQSPYTGKNQPPMIQLCIQVNKSHKIANKSHDLTKMMRYTWANCN